MKRYRVYAKNIITEELRYLGEIWATTLYMAKQKAGNTYGRDLEAYDTMEVKGER